ncbi:MAG: hypothetical protein ABIF82_07200 [Planctomycetota bacterium]
MIRGKLWELHDDETLRTIDAAANPWQGRRVSRPAERHSSGV